ncbi:hypothetical protein [Nannocystis sp. SCPEA4]|uniref:hypothetical protein n=1 Tax=Nannocystis sp. SCPEA4 TaxID=2996787 RepID=UPI00227184AC|nr:hypothetical protein [Nannocystis sp. SCPEA4]MCY1063037.1 hypothetical protein [Nannocystis sp. SCPEA4]
MSRTFTRERCIPWLFSQAGVQLDEEPEQVAPSVDGLRARIPRPAALGLRFTGLASLFAAAVVLMTGARPARAEGEATSASARTITGYTLGGLGVGAFVVGRRIGRSAPGLAVLCAGREADLDPESMTALVGGARTRMAQTAWPEGQVWLISEAPLSDERKAHAAGLKVRCFTPVNGRITEV